MFPFAFFALWALVLIWPLPLYLLTHIPLGNEKVGTVPFFNLWTLQWNIDQFTHGYPNYWDAPIFAPLTGTFAFSDIQPLSAFLAMPFWLGLQSAALGYNSTVILFLTLNGWFAYSLLRQWRRSFLVALSTGLIMQSLPFVAGQMGVLQLIAIFGFLWSLLFLSRFLVQSSSGKASWPTVSCLALGPPITFFTCSYYGLFSLLFLSLAFVFQLRPEHFKPKTLGVFLLAGLLSLILTGPLLWVQHEKLSQYGFGRTLQTIEENSARLSYYTSFLDYNLFYGQILGIRSGSGERLFPGIGLMLLATLGLFRAVAPTNQIVSDHGRYHCLDSLFGTAVSSRRF